MRILTQLLSIGLLLALQPYTVFGQSRPKVVIGYASMSSVVTTLWVAQDKGFFTKNNIDVQTVFIPGSPTLVASLNTGDVQFGYTGGTATLGAAGKKYPALYETAQSEDRRNQSRPFDR